MNRSTIYEVTGALLAFCGALVFGFGIYPHVNPMQFKLDLGPSYYAASLACIPTSLIMMAIGLLLSKQAQRIKRDEER
jgi:hypothetical protein